jgi:endonuclease/exonuclease/phosphatase (EEP) superfamily protein YafD
MFRNPSYEPLFVEIEWHDPDVVVLTEFSPAWSAAVDASPVMDQYPHRITDAREGAFGVALFSKTPLVEGEIWEVRDRPIARATVALGSDEVEIFGVHPPPPVSTTAIAIADDCWDEVLSQFARRTAPVVIVGDFNATQYSLVHQRIIDAGLSSAHELRGRGYATTWPNGLARRGITTPPIRIDHAMISSDLVCLDIQEGIGTGSDHKPLVLEVAILGRAGAAKGSMFVEFAMYFP